MNYRYAPVAALLALPVLLAATEPAVAQDAAANWAEIVRCGAIPKDKERHACADAVLERAGALASAKQRNDAKVAENRETFGLQPTRQREKPPVTVPVTVPPATPAATPAAVPLPPAAADRIETTVAKAFDPGNRLIVIITAEGAVWQQSELKDIGLPPRPGTAFAVDKGALGGFTCQVGKYKSFRCRRQD